MDEAKAEAKSGENKGFHLPEWVRDLALKILPYLVIALITANVGLFVDNINMKKDIAREMWRNDKQDMRQDRAEIRQDRTDDSIDDMRDKQSDFQNQALHRLDVLLDQERRR